MKKLFAKQVAARKRERGSVAGWIIAILLILAALVPTLLLISRWITGTKSYPIGDPLLGPPRPPQTIHNNQPIHGTLPESDTELLLNSYGLSKAEQTPAEASAPDAPPGGLPEEKNNEKGDE